MEVPGGTQLRGEVWTGPFMLRGKQAWHVRFTQLRLPSGDWQPVCFTTPFDGSLIAYQEGSKPGAILASKVFNLQTVWGRWPFP